MHYVFVLDEAGEHELESQIDEFGEDSYSWIKNIGEDLEKSAAKKILKFRQIKSLLSLAGGATVMKDNTKLYVCKLKGYPEICLDSIVDMLCFNEQSFNFNNDLIILKATEKNVFIQPFNHSLLRQIEGIYICYEIAADYINEESKQICGKPNYSFSLVNPESDDILSNNSWRIIFNFNGRLQDESEQLPADIIQNYKFEKYTDTTSGKSYFISEELGNISKVISNEKYFKMRILTLLEVIKDDSDMAYTFDEPFAGWINTVFPFITFIYGLSRIPLTSISGRIVHLSQSSGHGKTRLCFELLKFIGQGVYCVYRTDSSTGFPRITPWFNNLIEYFKNSSSDLYSMIICAKFILFCVENFKNFSGDELDIFEGKLPGKARGINFRLESQAHQVNEKMLGEIIAEISKKCGQTLFPIIFDESHEMLISPENRSDAVNLYRAMRRVLFLLKSTRIVGIYVGTKSSLSDFIITYHRDPCIREIVRDEEKWIDIPFYVYTQNVDSMFSESDVISYESCSLIKNIGGAHISHPKSLKEIARKLGRPLWSQYSFEYSVLLALEKLKTDRKLFELTCLILRTGSQIGPQDELAHKLVLSGMATLLYIDIDGSRCWVEYIPEPILSNAARIALTNIDILEKAIKEYLKRLQIGSFHDSASSGELVARIVLLRAMDLSVLKQQKVEDILFETKGISTYSFTEVFGSNTAEGLQKNVEFLQKSSNIFKLREENTKHQSIEQVNPDSIAEKCGIQVSSETSPNQKLHENSIFLSPFIGATTVREYLMFLANMGEYDDDDNEKYNDYEGKDGNEKDSASKNINSFLWKLGVSDEVLDGLVSFNQFIQTENPLIVNQQYLLHFFSRSCAMILAKGVPGVDLIIPVLRSDNQMSCIVIQVKNYGVQTFPYNSAETTAKFTRSYLKFLDFKAVAGFSEVPDDDFVRVVIQFNTKDFEQDESTKNISWVKITESISQSSSISSSEKRRRKSSRLNSDNNVECHAMWLRGLNCFESLFFGSKSIIDNLNIMLNGQRDFLSGLEYPKIKLPTGLQTSQEGARFLANRARTLANYNNVIVRDSQARVDDYGKKVYEEYLKDLDNFSIPQFSVNHLEQCTLSTEKAANTTKAPVMKICDYNAAPEEIKINLERILKKAEAENAIVLERSGLSIKNNGTEAQKSEAQEGQEIQVKRSRK